MAAAASEYEQLAYADAVLRRLAAECPDAAVVMVRTVEYDARIRLRRAVSLSRGSAFEIVGPQVLAAPRTRRTLELVAGAVDGPLPAIVPFVSAASAQAVTVAAAPRAGCTVSVAVADRAKALHWLAPWGRGEIESVSTHGPTGCQHGRPGDRAPAPGAGTRLDAPSAYLVFAGERDPVDPGDPRWGTARVGVVRSAPRTDSDEPGALASRGSRISVGDVEYVLVDQCP